MGKKARCSEKGDSYKVPTKRTDISIAPKKKNLWGKKRLPIDEMEKRWASHGEKKNTYQKDSFSKRRKVNNKKGRLKKCVGGRGRDQFRSKI